MLLTAEAAWDILDEQNTKYSCAVQMWAINYVHDASSTQTALAGSHQTNGRIPKDILYGELTAGKRNLVSSQLRYRDVCKQDMKKLSIVKNKWEELGTDRSK